jgi:Phage Tail Collar Domain
MMFLSSVTVGGTAGSKIALSGVTSNWINWSTAGVAAPSFTTRSVGTKLVLYPAVAGAAVDYAIGIESNVLWFSTQSTSTSFKWYAGTTNVATLTGLGTFTATALAGTGANITSLSGSNISAGTVGATVGGTGQTTVTTGDLLYGSAANTWSKLAGVATGNALISGGVGVAPSWGKIALTTHISGTLPVANGGTNQTTYAIGDILQASAATTLSKLASVATGNVLISGGVTTVSSWGKVGLTTHVSGTLPIANGGTNSTATATAGGIGYGTGTAHAYTAAGTAGQALISAAASAPSWTTLDMAYITSPLKKNCRVATTANLTLTGPGATIDGVTMSTGDRVLVKDQSTQSSNGIYTWEGAASSMVRAADADTAAEICGAIVVVSAGTANAGKTYSTNFASTDTLSTTALFWAEEDPVGEVIMWTGATTGGSAPFYTALPAGFALCDGTAISRTTYAKLFAAIGTRYGVGDGSTTFNLPTMTATIPIGIGSGGAAGNSTYTSSSSGDAHTHTTNVTYGGSGNNNKVSGNASATHTHTINVTSISMIIRYA